MPINYEQLKAIATGQTPAPQLLPEAMFLLADPFSTPLVKLLPGLNEAMPGVQIVGGVVGGGPEPGTNRVMINGQVKDGGAVCMALSGPIDITTTVSQGCRPVGEPMVITKSKRHVIQSLGGLSPLDAMRQLAARLETADRQLIRESGLYVGRVINEYKSRFGAGDFLIREMVAVDAQRGYMAVADPQIKTGQTIQFHVRDRTTADDDFAMLLDAQRVGGPAEAALLFSSNDRGMRMFGRPDADASRIYDALGAAPLAGFFGEGQFGPINGRNFHHRLTATLSVIRQKTAK